MCSFPRFAAKFGLKQPFLRMNEKATQLDHEPQDIIFKKKLITIEKGDFRTMNHFNLLGDYRVESRSYQNTIK